jgi:hypothetical protein
MKTPSEASDRHPDQGWLGYLGWVVTLLVATLLIYTGGAIGARVCYLKGVLPDGSRQVLFTTVPNPPRRKRLSKRVLGLI